VRLVNRSLGTGTRLLLDEWLEATGTQAQQLTGYDREESSHTALAACIAAGKADAGLGIDSAAKAHKLDFIPVLQEQYSLVCLKSALDNPAVAQLRQILLQPAWQQSLQQLSGYQVAPQSGEVHSLRRTLPWWP